MTNFISGKLNCRKLLSLVIVIAFSLSCEKFEYSPYQVKAAEDLPSDLNFQNVEKILSKQSSADDTVTFLFTGDSQRFYDELDLLVTKVNTLERVDFFVLSGDITDFGTLKEFEWICRSLEKLSVPYLCVIGNHDLTGRGSEVYTSMFGKKNFTLNYKGYKFLFHDTNSREYGFNGSVPDLTWMKNELKDSAGWYVGISHIPPFDVDFDRSLEEGYTRELRSHKNYILSLHGHLHQAQDSYNYNDHVRYIVCNSVEKREAVLLKLINGKIIKQTVSY